MFALLSHRVVVVLLIGVLAAAGDACAQTTWYVDDDAPGDAGLGDPTVSDPNENGSAAHPFDAIQEGIDAAVNGDTVLVLDGEYTGVGNRNLDFEGRLITVRSANGAASCVIDCQNLGRGFTFANGETAAAAVQGFTITNGSADHGGGMYNVGSSPTVTHCTFSSNAAESGGGMHNSYASPTVTHCTFSANEAGWGGGMYNFEGSPTVIHCTFSGDEAYVDGGGMRNQNSSPTVTNCAFSGNEAISGGGMWNLDSNPTVTQCTFSGNQADSVGGGMNNFRSSSTVVTHCTFSGNEAVQGGGMYNVGSSPTVINCILWNDTPEEIYNYDDPNYPSAPTVTYSDVQGGTGEPWLGIGCLDDDPLFIDADGPDDTFGTDDDNLRLSAGSPCIDAGDNAAVPPGLTTDLGGNPRISHGTVDMGAYERQDDDGDGVVDGSDVCPGFDDSADADNDGVPDGCDDCADTPTCATVDADGCPSDSDDDSVLNGCDDCPATPTCATNVDADGCAIDSDADGVVDGCDDCADTPSCATNVDTDGCAIDSDGDGAFDGCAAAGQEMQGCCGGSGPVAPLGLAVAMLLLSRFGGHRDRRRSMSLIQQQSRLAKEDTQ